MVAVHRWHGGVHGAYNNVLKGGGCHVLSGDTHRLAVRARSSFGGMHYAVQAGTMAEASSPLFEYCRGIEPDWQSGFAVLTIRDGVLLPPEVATVRDGACWFRGYPIAGRARVRAGMRERAKATPRNWRSIRADFGVATGLRKLLSMARLFLGVA